jgi:hypothetical protein
MYSDRGTNFTGASRELTEGLARLNHNKFCHELCKMGVTWYFNPPQSSHQGGAWERMIGLVRKVLRIITAHKKYRSPTPELFNTFMKHAECVLNSRPLVGAGEDIKDLAVLTPMTILQPSAQPPSHPADLVMSGDELRATWKSGQLVADLFWEQFIKFYLPVLQKRHRWTLKNRDFKVGDLVLVVGEDSPRHSWPKAIVAAIIVNNDGHVRRVTVRFPDRSTAERDIRKLCLLEAAE